MCSAGQISGLRCERPRRSFSAGTLPPHRSSPGLDYNCISISATSIPQRHHDHTRLGVPNFRIRLRHDCRPGTSLALSLNRPVERIGRLGCPRGWLSIRAEGRWLYKVSVKESCTFQRDAVLKCHFFSRIINPNKKRENRNESDTLRGFLSRGPGAHHCST